MKYKIIESLKWIIFFIVILNTNLKGQNQVNVQAEKEVFSFVEQMPEFPDGQMAMMKFIRANINYPEEAKLKHTEGTTTVKFVIEADGILDQLQVERWLTDGCSEEAVRVLSIMPRWKPGQHNSKNVAVRYTIPIKFQLPEDTPFDSVKLNNYYKEKAISKFVEKMPEFPGGATAIMNFINDNINYPEEAKIKGIEGTIIMQFVVTEDGSLTKFRCTTNIGGGCVEEGIRVLSNMPKWIPGKHNGYNVPVDYTLPIKFKL